MFKLLLKNTQVVAILPWFEPQCGEDIAKEEMEAVAQRQLRTPSFPLCLVEILKEEVPIRVETAAVPRFFTTRIMNDGRFFSGMEHLVQLAFSYSCLFS